MVDFSILELVEAGVENLQKPDSVSGVAFGNRSRELKWRVGVWSRSRESKPRVEVGSQSWESELGVGFERVQKLESESGNGFE